MLVIAIVLLVAAGASGEDSCFHKATNSPGICLLLINCTYAYEGVLNQVEPQVCRLAETAPIVCCPILTTTPTPTPPVSTTTPRPTPTPPVSTTTPRRTPTTLSSMKCLEYSNSVKRDRCRIKDVTNAGSSMVSLGEFPHIAAILFNPKYVGGQPTYKCFGSLISERFVLMPGYCYFFRGEQPIEVHLGLVSLTSTDWPNVQKLKLKAIKVHPDNKYDLYDDLALIELNGDVHFNQYVHPICLGDDGDNSILAGWTMMNETVPNSHMEEASVEVVSSTDCETVYAPLRRQGDDLLSKGIPDDKLICATAKGGLAFAQGSSLLTRSKEVDCMHTLVGSLTFSTIYTGNLPAIITRIQTYRSWIESVVWPK